MSTLTPNLGLFKYDVTNDSQTAFSITNALNNNWDKLDTAIANASGVTTTVNGTTWIRQWNDGWKEQGGKASIGSTWVEWQQPVLTSYNSYGLITTGGMQDGKYADTYRLAYQGLNENNTPTNVYDQLIGETKTPVSNWINWKFPTYMRFRSLKFWNLYNSGYIGNTKTIIAYTDSTKTTEMGRVVNTNTVQGTCTLYCDDTIVTDNIYLDFPDGYGNFTPAIYKTQISAYELTSTVNNITYPSAFSNNNYGFSLGLLGSQVKFVSATNKTVSGMSLNNVSDSCTVYWKAWGY